MPTAYNCLSYDEIKQEMKKLADQLMKHPFRSEGTLKSIEELEEEAKRRGINPAEIYPKNNK